MLSQSVAVSDSVSRWLAVGAIVVSIGSAVLLYQDNQRLKTELATLKETSSNTSPAAFESFADEWDKKLLNALTEFEKLADESTKKFDAARMARNRIAEEATETSGVSLTRSEIEDIVATQIDKRQLAPLAMAELVVPQVVLRTTNNVDFPQIRNVGDLDAEIIAARFKPQKDGVFRVKGPIPEADQRVVIEFEPGDNKGAIQDGGHRFYERRYDFPEQVVPKQSSAEVSIEIRANGRHLDWGLRGTLELDYQDGRTVLIPEARAIFVPDQESTA